MAMDERRRQVHPMKVPIGIGQQEAILLNDAFSCQSAETPRIEIPHSQKQNHRRRIPGRCQVFFQSP